MITGPLEYLIQPDVTVTRQRERGVSDVWEMFKAAFGRCQESETQRTHLDWIFLALAAAYIEPSQISTFSGNFVIYGIFVFIVKDNRHLTGRWRERGGTGWKWYRILSCFLMSAHLLFTSTSQPSGGRKRASEKDLTKYDRTVKLNC